MKTGEFSTRRFPLAIFVHATRKLPFLRLDPGPGTSFLFVFRDDKHEGSHVELEFDQGASVVARDLFSSQTYLRRALDDAQIGEFENDRHTTRR